MAKSEKLAQLEREFSSPLNRAIGTMKLDDYLSKRAAIEAEPDPPAPAPKAASAPPRYVTMRGLGVLVKAVREYVAEQVSGFASASRVAELTTLVEKLERRIGELEKQKTAYRGVWRDAPHLPGDAVTHKGTLWFCHEATTDRPGTSDAWQLMIKHER
jgi:hypothetical protein